MRYGDRVGALTSHQSRQIASTDVKNATGRAPLPVGKMNKRSRTERRHSTMKPPTVYLQFRTLTHHVITMSGQACHGQSPPLSALAAPQLLSNQLLNQLVFCERWSMPQPAPLLDDRCHERSLSPATRPTVEPL
jgi:hypothetical protein